MKVAKSDIYQTENIGALSAREARLLSTLAGRGRTIFAYADLLQDWPDRASLRTMLSKLAARGWVRRLGRGLYMLVPLEAGPGRHWAEQPYIVASHLLQPAAIAYWSALHFWQLTEQRPSTVFIQSPTRTFHRTWQIDGVSYQAVNVKAERFFGLASMMVGGHSVTFTNRTRTLIDALDRPDLSGGILLLADSLQQHWRVFDWDEVDASLVRFNSGAVYKRLGYLVEHLALPLPDLAGRLADWQARITPGLARLEPGLDTVPNLDRRWRIDDNVGIVPSSIAEDA